MDDAGQLALLPGADPDALVAEAVERFRPIASFCLFSGGGDSQALAVRCREHYGELAFIDAGGPVSDVSALMHRSGECNCGAFAVADDERAMLKGLWPAWWARIETLELEAEAAGIRWCRWGGFDVDGIRAGGDAEPAGELCTSCEFRQEVLGV